MKRIHLLSCLALASLLAASAPALAQSGGGDEDKEQPAGDGDDGGDAAEAGEGTGEGAEGAGETEEPEAADVDALRKEYLKLRDELFRSRARAATVASAMFSTKVTLYLNYKSGRFYTVTRATARLDGANVYDDTQGAISNDKATRFEGWMAPGRHKLAIRIEAVGKDDERFTVDIENSFTFQAPGGKDVTLIANVEDEGDIAYAWKKKQKGSYKLRVNLNVKTAKRGAKKKLRGSIPKKTRTRTAAK